MGKLFWVCLGGAAGCGGRYLIGLWAVERFGTRFPAGTLAVNVVGSLLMGVLMYLGAAARLFSPDLRLALTTGMLGGFTTYSSFAHETLQYLQQGAWGLAAGYALLTTVACVAACGAGYWIARAVVG